MNWKRSTTEIERHYDTLDVALHADYPKRQFEFCGELMPVNQPSNYKKIHKEVRKYLAHRNGLKQLFKRADHYFPYIEKRLTKCNLPEDLKYIPMIESRFVHETSSKGAQGFWQFMPITAVQFGLKVNDQVDERLDLKLSTNAACSYLNTLHSALNSWTLSAAAYNAGLSKVDNKIEDNDKKLFANYYNTSWNSETASYVFKLMAIKHIYENRQAYGL
jgi:membrane-bound lytic murein transglycosylase D